MLFAVLAFAAVVLTYAMFQSRNAMLGFPAAIMWALLGGYCYTQSTVPWGDIYFYLFVASVLGMTPFSMFAAYGLRTKKEELKEGGEYIDEGKDDLRFIDEDRKGEYVPEKEDRIGDEPSEPDGPRQRAIARSRQSKTKRKVSWGEFK
jgi:hypothetical protein